MQVNLIKYLKLKENKSEFCFELDLKGVGLIALKEMMKRAVSAWKSYVRPFNFEEHYKRNHSYFLYVVGVVSGLFFGYSVAKKYATR